MIYRYLPNQKINLLEGGRLHGDTNEESVVNNFANYLTQVFRDNKWILPYFSEKLLDKPHK